jgi:hypothetical protein
MQGRQVDLRGPWRSFLSAVAASGKKKIEPGWDSHLCDQQLLQRATRKDQLHVSQVLTCDLAGGYQAKLCFAALESTLWTQGTVLRM